MLKKSYANRLMDNYENLFNRIQENEYCLNYATNPGGKLADKFLKQLEKAGYNNLKVDLKNPNTDMSLGCSADAAVVLLATIKIMEKVVGDAQYTKLFNKFNTLYGYGIKIKGTTNSFEAVVSLFILYKLTKDSKYYNLLADKFNVTVGVESEIGNFLYSELDGIKDV